MKIPLNEKQIKFFKGLTEKNEIKESLDFQYRVCNAMFECFIKKEKEREIYLNDLMYENLKCANYPTKEINKILKSHTSKIIVESVNIKENIKSHFDFLEKTLVKKINLKEDTEEKINTVANGLYDFKLYYDEKNQPQYSYRKKGTEQWYESNDPELDTEIKNRVKFDGIQSAESQPPTDEKIEKKVKKIGLDRFFNGMRKALMSPMGALVQKFLSLTGIGAVATTVLWGVLTIYDAFKALSGTGSWMNLIIDLLCLASNGYLSKFLKPLQGIVSKTAKQAIDYITKSSGLGKLAGKFLPKIVEKYTNISNLIQMGIDWANKKLKTDLQSGQGAIDQVTTELKNTPVVTQESFLLIKKQLIKQKNIYKKNEYEKYFKFR